VATDLNTLATVTFASGPLPQAVRASISIPGVFLLFWIATATIWSTAASSKPAH